MLLSMHTERCRSVYQGNKKANTQCVPKGYYLLQLFRPTMTITVQLPFLFQRSQSVFNTILAIDLVSVGEFRNVFVDEISVYAAYTMEHIFTERSAVEGRCS